MKDRLMIYVPTRGRTHAPITLQNLPGPMLRHTTVVCDTKQEAKFYNEEFPELYRVRWKPFPHIAAKRAWIFQTTTFSKIIMIDDDLSFAIRGAKGKLVSLNSDNDLIFNGVWEILEEKMENYRHGGISQRFMNQHKKGSWEYNAKAHHAMFYHVPTVKKHCKLGQTDRFEDLDYTLQLLRAGFENAIYNDMTVTEPKGFNAPGGVSLYRTAAKIDTGLQRLAKLHPGIVTIVPREDNDGDTAFKGNYRPIIRWKKAIAEGRKKNASR